VPTVRFNFRGVAQQRRATMTRASANSRMPCPPVPGHAATGNCEGPVAAGFSFGSAVALQAAAVARPAMLVTVAPPVRTDHRLAVLRPDCPWLVVQGDRDELVDVHRCVAVGEFRPPPQLWNCGAEHFFHGRLGELRAAVAGFLSSPVAGGE